MFGEPGSVSDGADGEGGGFVEHVKGAFVTRSDSREDDSRLAFETYDLRIRREECILLPSMPHLLYRRR
jgi:hypothetical protein